jgi:ABC-type antimicrobial peptide transport system permease subunit
MDITRDARHALRMLLRTPAFSVIVPAVSGVAIGLIAAFFLSRCLESLLFGVRATDPLTFLLMAVCLIVVAAIACWIPARRATRIDPLLALRAE